MWFLALIACSGGGSSGTLPASTYLPPWATHLEYEEVDATALDGIEDTSTTLAHILHIGVSGDGDSWTWEVREGDDYATASTVLTLGLSTASGLEITSVDGTDLSPTLTLLSANYTVDEAVASGDSSAKPTRLDTLNTWYGTFSNVVDIEVSGPTVATFKMAEGIGPVQFAWGDVAGDLAWYQ